MISVDTMSKGEALMIPRRAAVATRQTNSRDESSASTQEIRLYANYFKIKIKMNYLFQYKIAFLASKMGPSLKTREDRCAVFQALLGPRVKHFFL